MFGQLRLDVAEDGTHLVYADRDSAFFYVGDTAWELLHRADEAESRLFLEDRAHKGFNVVQTVVLAELKGLTEANANGDLPLNNLDPTDWNEAYFAHVDRVAEIADSLGIFLGLLPAWGDKWSKLWGEGPEVFTPENAVTYGRMLGERYGANNVIWILGGDRNPRNPTHEAITEGMAEGLRQAIGQRQLITYHPRGGSKSTEFWAGADWIDFHMYQTGHGKRDDKANYDFPREMRETDPNKPVVNGEPAYEGHPVNWRADNGWFDDYDSRVAAWWSVLSGTAGHTFGNNSIWQMYLPQHDPFSSAFVPWQQAMHYPGAAQIGHLGRLMQSLPYYELTPDWNVFDAAPNSSGRETLAARTDDGTLLIAYTPYGDALRMTTDKMDEASVYEWFDPRTGKRFAFTPEIDGQQLVFNPPFEAGRGNDWVLIGRPR